MRRKPLNDMTCSIAKALDVVGDPWTMLIVRDALVGVTRFEQFSERLGIPRATLSSRLDQLCDTDVMEKVAYQDTPQRFDYLLTPKGRSLRTVVITLMQWGDEWARDDDPPTRIVEVATGRRVEPILVDRETGRPLDELGVRAVGRVTEGLAQRSPATPL